MTGVNSAGESVLSRAWQRVADREAVRVRDVFLKGSGERPAARSVLAYALAAVTILAYLLVAAAGVWLVAWAFGLFGLGPTNFIRLGMALLVALPLLGYAVMAFPRFGVPEGTPVTAEQAPELYRLIGQVAGALKVPAPERVVVFADVNAYMGRAGLPPRPVLGLGLPLWYGLHPQERVAILAHELAHARNGDPVRSTPVHAALHMLAQGVNVLTPNPQAMAARVPIIGYLMLLMRLVPLGLHAALVNAIGAEHQTAEFRADLLAARLAGSDAVVSALDKLHLASALEGALHKQRHMPERPHAFLELRHIWDTLPEEQRQRKREERAAQRVRLDDSHPPTADRMQVIQAHPHAPQLILTDEQAQRIDAELTPFVQPLADRAYEQYQARYTG